MATFTEGDKSYILDYAQDMTDALKMAVGDKRMWLYAGASRTTSLDGVELQEYKFYRSKGGFIQRTTRNEDTKYGDLELYKRYLTKNDYYRADLVDNQIDVKRGFEPTDAIYATHRNELIKLMNHVFRQALIGNALELQPTVGNDTKIPTTVALPTDTTTTVVPHNLATGAYGCTTTTLNVDKVNEVVRRARDINHIEMDMQGQWFLATTVTQYQHLMASRGSNSELLLIDENLVRGMGTGTANIMEDGQTIGRLNIIVDSDLNHSDYYDSSGYQRNFMWASEGMVMATDVDGTVGSLLPQKTMSAQFFTSAAVGAARLEEKLVYDIRATLT